MIVTVLDPKKITQLIVDVTNACDKDHLTDVIKVPITSKTILTESELETVRNSTWLSMAQYNSVYSIPCMHITQTSLCIYTYSVQINLNSFVKSVLHL